MPVYSAGSANVKVVPDFSGGEMAIKSWFARQGDLNVKVKPNISDTSLAATKAKLDSVEGTAKVHVDHKSLAESIASSIDTVVKDIAGMNVLGSAVNAAIVPTLMSTAAGGLTELVGSLSQVLGLLALAPAGIMGMAAPMGVLLLGTSGLTKAFGVLSSTVQGNKTQMAAAQKALDGLAPSAQNFIAELGQLRPAFESLKLGVQQQLFAGLGDQIERLGNVALPVMQTGLSGIAGAMNAGLLATMQRLVTMGPSFTTIFANIGSAARTVSTGAIPTLVTDFVSMANMGSQFLPQLAAGFVTLTNRLDAFIVNGLNTGSFVRLIQQAIQVVDVLGRIVGHVGSVINSVLSAALPFGDQLLGMLDKVTGQLAAFLKTTEAQNSLAEFFKSVAAVVAQLLPVLLQLVQALVVDVLPAVGDLAQAIGPVIGELGHQLVEVLDKVSQMFPPLAEVIGELVSSFSPLIPLIGQLITTLLPPLLVLGHALAPTIDALEKVIAAALIPAAQVLAPVLQAVGLAFLQIFNALLPILPPLLQLVIKLLPPLLSVVIALLPVFTELAPILTTVVNAFVSFAGPAVSAVVNLLVSVLLPVLQKLRPILPEIALAILAWATYSKILAGAMAAIDFVKWLSFLVQYFVQVNLVAAATKAWAIAQGIWAVVTNLGVYAQLAKTLALYIVQVDLVTAATKAWAAVQAVLDALTSPIALLIMAIVAAVAALAFGIYELVTHWTQVWSTIKRVAADVWGWMQSAWHTVTSALVSAWNTVSGAISSAWNTVIRAVFDAFQTAASWLYNNVLHPVFTGIKTAWNALATAFKWAWDNIIHPVWVVIEDAGKVLAAILGIVVFGPIALAWKALSIAIPWAWDNLIKPAWEAIKGAARQLLDQLKLAWHGIQVAWAALGTAVQWVYDNVILPVWHALEAAARWTYNNVLLPTWHGIETAWRALGTAVKWVYDNVILVVWHALETAARWTYNNVLLPTWHGIQTAWNALGTAIRWVNDNVIQPVWNALQTAVNFLWNDVLRPIWSAIQTGWHDLATGISDVYHTVVDGVWSAFQAALSGLQGAFRTAVAVIKDVWHGIEAIVATPVNFVINTILDGGLFKAWNWIVDTLHLPGNWKLHVDPIPGFAEGGFTGPGIFGTGGKHDPAGVVHAGEFVVNQQQTSRFLPLLQAINDGMPGYDSGGFVGWLGKLWHGATDIFGSLKDSITGPISKLLSGFGDAPWEQMLAKLPQTLVGDMWSFLKDKIGSAFNSVLSALTTSNSPYGGGSVARVPSSRAANENAVALVAGLHGWGPLQNQGEWQSLVNVLMRESGFNNNAQNPTSTAYGMFQFLDSTWAGYPYGKTSDPYQQAVDGLLYIQRRYHSPSFAWAHELNYGWYDQGGYLPPGITTVFNGTGRPEPVLTAAQTDALMRAAGVGPNGTRGGSDVPLIGQLTIQEASNPRSVIDEMWYDLQVASRGGKYSLAGAAR